MNYNYNYYALPRQRAGKGIWLEAGSLLLLIAAFFIFVKELVDFSQIHEAMPDVTVAQIPLYGMTRPEAVAALERAYAAPLEVLYQDNVIVLDPASIGFRLNTEALISRAESMSAAKGFWPAFWDYLWRRPSTAVTLDLESEYYQYIPSQLHAFLEDIAARYDSPPTPASYDLATMSFRMGTPGHTLDIEASIPLIEEALQRPTDRRVELVVNETDAPRPDMETLEALILDYFDELEFNYDGRHTIASIFIMDLQTGQELNLNPGIAYAGMSIIKIPILTAMYRYLNNAPNLEQARLIAQTMICSGNFTANLLLAEVGHGDQLAGANYVTDTMRQLGLENTFLIHPLFVTEDDPIYPVTTPTIPADQQRTQPDPFSQTTPEDIGTLLAMIYDCAMHGGGLMAALPGEIDQIECRQMLEVMSGNHIGVLIEAGVPEGTRVSHKHGWISDTHGDAGIVYTPGGDYVIVMFFYNEGHLNYLEYWPIMAEISRATYNLFNMDNPLLFPREVETATAEECDLPDDPALIALNDIDSYRRNATPTPETPE